MAEGCRICGARPCGVRRADPVLRSDPPSTLVQEPFPVTGPASRGTERGTRAPSRLTGTQGAVGAVLVVLALGLALRLIIAYLFPGSGFGVDLAAFQFWAGNLAAQGPHGFYDRDFFHDYTPGYLYVLWVLGLIGQRHRRRRRRADQDPGDPRRPGHRLAGLVDDPRARRTSQPRARGRLRRRRQPDQLVRLGRLGAGRLGRRRLPAARAARAVARPPRTGGDLRGHRRPDQAAARHPHPDPDRGDHPASVVAGPGPRTEAPANPRATASPTSTPSPTPRRAR